MHNALKSAPRVRRLKSARPMSALGKIEPTGGRYGAGLIPNVSLCSRGEALGHDAWVDAVMLQQIVDGCNSNPKLLKSRFTHPDLCESEPGKPSAPSKTRNSRETRPSAICTSTRPPTTPPMETSPDT